MSLSNLSSLQIVTSSPSEVEELVWFVVVVLVKFFCRSASVAANTLYIGGNVVNSASDKGFNGSDGSLVGAYSAFDVVNFSSGKDSGFSTGFLSRSEASSIGFNWVSVALSLVGFGDGEGGLFSWRSPGCHKSK